MKNRKIPIPGRLILVAGSLMVALPQLLKMYFHIPDFVLGALAGAGCGLEIIAIIKLKNTVTTMR